MSDEKSFSVCQEMLPLFRAVLKFCSTNRLFKNQLYQGRNSNKIKNACDEQYWKKVPQKPARTSKWMAQLATLKINRKPIEKMFVRRWDW